MGGLTFLFLNGCGGGKSIPLKISARGGESVPSPLPQGTQKVPTQEVSAFSTDFTSTPVYRYVNLMNNDHLYSNITNELTGPNYSLEFQGATVFKVLKYQVAGSVPLYRCLFNGLHFISLDSHCESTISSTTFEFVYGYVFASYRPGFVELFRMRHPASGNIFFTSDVIEFNSAIVLGWVADPIIPVAAYVLPSSTQ